MAVTAEATAREAATVGRQTAAGASMEERLRALEDMLLAAGRRGGGGSGNNGGIDGADGDVDIADDGGDRGGGRGSGGGGSSSGGSGSGGGDGGSQFAAPEWHARLQEDLSTEVAVRVTAAVRQATTEAEVTRRIDYLRLEGASRSLTERLSALERSVAREQQASLRLLETIVGAAAAAVPASATEGADSSIDHERQNRHAAADRLGGRVGGAAAVGAGGPPPLPQPQGQGSNGNGNGVAARGSSGGAGGVRSQNGHGGARDAWGPGPRPVAAEARLEPVARRLNRQVRPHGATGQRAPQKAFA
ncbi:unnamed protein product [Phaeothamnion confervicola]